MIQWLRSGYTLMALAALGFSFKSVLVKLLLTRYELDVMTLLMMRQLLGAPLFLIALVALGRAAIDISAKRFGIYAYMGGVLMLSSMYWSFEAVRLLGASLTTLIIFVYPVMVIAMLSLLEGRIRTRQLIAALLGMAGLVLVLQPWNELDEIIWPGVGAALLAAFFWALYNVCSEKWLADDSSVRQAAFTALLALAIMSPLFGDQNYPADPNVWLLVGMLALFVGFIPFLLFLEGLRRIGAGPGAIMNMLAPAFNMLWAYIAFGEARTTLQFAGVLLLFAGMAGLKFAFPRRALRRLYRRWLLLYRRPQTAGEWPYVSLSMRTRESC